VQRDKKVRRATAKYGCSSGIHVLCSAGKKTMAGMGFYLWTLVSVSSPVSVIAVTASVFTPAPHIVVSVRFSVLVTSSSLPPLRVAT
jgi:hypothetical protein